MGVADRARIAERAGELLRGRYHSKGIGKEIPFVGGKWGNDSREDIIEGVGKKNRKAG
jgi:hypothetical protein